MTEKPTEGWTWLRNATKLHYFVDGRSLCRRWLGFGIDDDLDPIMTMTANCCVGCMRRLKEKERVK